MLSETGHDVESAAGFPSPVVGCAQHLYDHNYDVTFALEHILQDKENFFETLGTKKRSGLSDEPLESWRHHQVYREESQSIRKRDRQARYSAGW